jgi:hypothetical protein
MFSSGFTDPESGFLTVLAQSEVLDTSCSKGTQNAYSKCKVLGIIVRHVVETNYRCSKLPWRKRCSTPPPPYGVSLGGVPVGCSVYLSFS